ncbi:MAG: hypothetical protein NZ561_08220 [Phycisphaerae bacterium]|nr:hypothetical protein [Phycisphaerae bacterium]MDW8263442.1 hypothetical protein [Phycisphaerales bacterium]
MIRFLAASLAPLLLTAAAGAQSVANPLYSAWVRFETGATSRYTGVSRTLGVETTIETTMKLIEKAGDRVVIEVSRKVTSGDDTVEESPRKEEIRAMIAQEAAMVPAGEEPATAGGKEYPCRVYQQQRKEGDLLLLSRFWLSDEVPGGIVKIDSKVEGPIAINTLLELKSFSR